MEKLYSILLFSILLTVSTIMVTATGNSNHPPKVVIEKIEKKYEEMSVKAPFVKVKGQSVAKTIRFIQPTDNTIGDYSKLRQIALVRHGEPDLKKDGTFTCDEASEFLKCYDSVCIIVPEKPFFEVEEKEEIEVFSSPINRALTTAHYLFGPEKDINISPVFREFENKISKINSGKRLPIKFWTTTSRLKWMLGMGKSNGIETFSDAKKRAQEAADMLVNASEKNPKVLLTAHGFLNRYIKKDLKKKGWKVVADTGNNYFGTTILVKVEE